MPQSTLPSSLTGCRASIPSGRISRVSPTCSHKTPRSTSGCANRFQMTAVFARLWCGPLEALVRSAWQRQTGLDDSGFWQSMASELSFDVRFSVRALPSDLLLRSSPFWSWPWASASMPQYSRFSTLSFSNPFLWPVRSDSCRCSPASKGWSRVSAVIWTGSS